MIERRREELIQMMKWLVRGVLSPWRRLAGRGRQALALALVTLVAGAGAAVAFTGSDGTEETSATTYSTSTTESPSPPTTPETSSPSDLVSLGGSTDDTDDTDDTYDSEDTSADEDSDDDYDDYSDDDSAEDYEAGEDDYSEDYSDESEDSSELTYPILVSASSMIEFTQNSGNPAWADNAESRLLSVEIEFRDDGTFTLDAEDSASLPLDGSYTASGSELSFEGSAGSASSNGSSNVEVLGTVDLDDETMTIDWIATSGMSAYVNDTGYASSNAASYTAELDVSIS